jgi:pSer/pThr/pTyr-binding forkhead associated (FHA) protein
MATRGGKAGAAREATRFVGGAESPKREDEYSTCFETAQKSAFVLAYGGPGKGGEFPLARDEMLIGRDPAADISIDDPAMSRRHAVIVRRKGRFVLRDLGSANGSYLEGVLHNAERPLDDGARFRIGKTDFVLRDPGAAKPQR